MALASNPLIQALQTAKAQSAVGGAAAKPQDNGAAQGPSFADVYARQNSAKPAQADNTPAKARSADDTDRKDPAAKPADDDNAVADSGNSLPAKAAGDKQDTADDASDEDPALVDIQPGTTVDPTLDPALVATPTPVEVPPQAPEPDPVLLAVVPVAIPLPPPVVTDEGEAAFDPSADALDGLPAVQLALEASKTRQGAQANDKLVKGAADDSANLSQLVANNLSASDDASLEGAEADGEGDKAFTSLLGDGLKDVKHAASDTRVDNFADRLAALSQAAQQRPVAAQTPAQVLNQPLAMHQSGLVDEVVNRVMYLSSQNLKSAQIQLEPAELGRLDIRVNMAQDQSNVTFLSPHLVVREALESQMGRLRDSFQQQGLGQVDVNVAADQQAWQQGQRQQEQASEQSRRSTGAGDRVEGAADESIAAISETPAAGVQQVVGSSAVDYYA